MTPGIPFESLEGGSSTSPWNDNPISHQQFYYWPLKPLLKLRGRKMITVKIDHLLSKFLTSSSEMGFRQFVSLLKFFAEFHRKCVHLSRNSNIPVFHQSLKAVYTPKRLSFLSTRVTVCSHSGCGLHHSGLGWEGLSKTITST